MDHDDFDRVFKELYPRARALALRILGDEQAAEDAAAEAMARALRDWPRVGRLAYRDGYVLRITSHVALDAARRRDIARRSFPMVGPGGGGVSADELAMLRAALVQALLTLSRRQREAIVLVHLVGLSPTEAAATMRVSVSSVGQHVRRGLDHMRGQFNDDPLSLLPEGGTL